MAYKQSPIGKRKCPYSPMQKRGLINESPVMMNGNTVASSGGKSVDVDRKAGGNVNYMIRQGFQPKGEYVNDRGTRIVKYMNKKGDTQYHQFNNKPDSDNKLHRVIDQKTYRDLLSKGQGDRLNKSKFKALKDVEERDMSGGHNRSMTEQVTTGKMAGNYEEEV